MNYVFYKTTNTITKQFYYGVFSYDPSTSYGVRKHKTYIGAGIIAANQASKLKPANFIKSVVEYGYENFSREDILVTTDKEEAYAMEAVVVTRELIETVECLNRQTGGLSPKMSDITKFLISKSNKGNPKLSGKDHPFYGRKLTPEQKEALHGGRRGQKNTDEHRAILSKVNKGRKRTDAQKKAVSDANTGGKHGMAKKVIDTETGLEYGCIREAADALKINYNTLYHRIKRNPDTTRVQKLEDYNKRTQSN